MRILMLHNRYIYRGGEDESTDAEAALLREHGNEVDLLELNNESISPKNILKTGMDTVWSRDAYRLVLSKCRENKYDVVHVQNFFPLFSPSIHYACKVMKIPVVQALRNYRLSCLNGFFYRDDHVCEDCLGRAVPLPGVIHKCYRDSRAGSSVVAAMLVTHRALRTWWKKVDAFYTLTEFARAKLVAGGLPAERVYVKPNFITSAHSSTNTSRKDYALFIGRLSPEKGLETMLDAWSKIKYPVKLKIVGDGPLSDMVKTRAALDKRVELLGKMDHAKIFPLLYGARFLIFPSRWYETFGRTIIEAFSCGIPVIGSNNGAASELITDQVTGWLFNPYSANDLAAKVEYAWMHPEQTNEMGYFARKEYEAKHTEQKNYEMMITIYQQAIENYKAAK